jgi:UDP-N-acetylglucosamine--N-acetylmuramyl-(pentapeptide) pyrophosphoryl-undecaprenol N-acetylglucosamine transferase
MDEGVRAPGSRARHVLLAGGGSGGHVFPALAVGAELGRRGWRVSYAGDPAGMEARLVAGHGVDFVPLPARPLVGRGPLARLGALATLARSTAAARRAVRGLGIDAVVGTGGYASAPAVLGGAWARRPTLLVEPNARPGAANRWLSRVATAAAVAYEAAGRELACPSFVAGVPIRARFFALPALAADAPPRLVVLGGSQGSRRLNGLLPAAVARALARVPALTVLHQCGERHVEEARALWQASAVPAARVELVPFVADVAAALADATLVLSRAGAITLAEICAAGRPSVLVPLALAGAHQRANAALLEAAGAALRFEEEGATAEGLGARLADALADGAALAAMGARARALARPAAAAAIADRVASLVAARSVEERP